MYIILQKNKFKKKPKKKIFKFKKAYRKNIVKFKKPNIYIN